MNIFIYKTQWQKSPHAAKNAHIFVINIILHLQEHSTLFLTFPTAIKNVLLCLLTNWEEIWNKHKPFSNHCKLLPYPHSLCHHPKALQLYGNLKVLLPKSFADGELHHPVKFSLVTLRGSPLRYSWRSKGCSETWFLHLALHLPCCVSSDQVAKDTGHAGHKKAPLLSLKSRSVRWQYNNFHQANSELLWNSNKKTSDGA